MNRNLLSLLLFILTLTVHAQQYDFNKYKYRVNGFRALNLNSSFYGNSYYTTAVSNYFNSSGRLTFEGNYSRFINTEKHIKNISYGLNMNASALKSNFGNNEASVKISNFYFNSEDYNYKGKIFLVSRSSMSGSLNQTGIDPLMKLQKQRDHQLNGSIEIGFGKGRLEYISDPVLANFILLDLKKKGVISSYTPLQVESFGIKISQILSMRMIDYRFRLIDQIHILDSFLSREIKGEKDNATFYTTLYDNWLYANRFQRFAGKRNEVLFGDHAGEFNLMQKFRPDSIHNTRYFNNTLFVAFQHTNEKPVNLTFQRLRSFRAEFRFMENMTQTNIPGFDSYRNNSYQVDLNYLEGIGWYPNTRTYLTANVRVQVNYQFKRSILISGAVSNLKPNDIVSLNISPSLNLFYFFSPRFRLNGAASLSFNNFKNIDSGYPAYPYLSSYFYGGLAYVFF